MQIDPYILAFSALTVIATVWMGFWSAKRSRTAGDFFVAGRGAGGRGHHAQRGARRYERHHAGAGVSILAQDVRHLGAHLRAHGGVWALWETIAATTHQTAECGWS